MKYQELINDISNINNSTLTTVERAINKTLTIRNWFIDAYIIEYEQNGVDRAAYGTQLPARSQMLAESVVTIVPNHLEV
ncbi:hypothetical protein F7734_40360 [Scytonema sp. UIC 10036]|uniref:hypothetical protein n=1 Tax=Scytonema sp. UIC 10036 TaxID=2304196 RepID=UPI0012DA82B0|nr:hypothetical protein [Scytonema sp. UIC 10036]MUG98234.1 hypothetical protein [Scytonema sp. UIC 10036]